MSTVTTLPPSTSVVEHQAEPVVRPGFLRRNGHHFLALFLFTVLTLIYTWPLLLQFSTHVVGVEKTDNYELLWLFRWVPDALLKNGADPWFAPDIYAPWGYPIVYGETTPLHSFLLMPLTVIAGEVVTFNLVMLVSTVLTAWSIFALTFVWLARLEGYRDQRLLFLAAFFAGIAFTFSTYRIMKLQAQLNLFNTQFIIMGLYFWDSWLSKPRLRHALLTGLALGLAALSSWYLGVMLGLSLVVYTAGYGRLAQRLREPRLYRDVFILLTVCAAMCLPFIIPYLQLGSLPEVPLEKTTFWSASPTDYLLPNPLHPIWGSWTQPLAWPFEGKVPSEFTVPIGFTVLLFAIYGSRQTRGPNWRGLKWVILVAVVLSLGPMLHLSRLSTGIPLPAMLLRELPIFNGLRTWIRFAFMVQIGLAVLGAAGIYLALWRSSSRRLKYGGAAVLILLALFEAWPGSLGTIPVESRPVDYWLAEQTSDAPIMEYPLGVAMSGPSLFYTQTHGKPITYAYGTYFEMIYLERNPELETFPADAALDTLEEWGVRFILVTASAIDQYTPFSMDDIQAQPRLRYVTTQADVEVFELIPAESAVS